MFSRLMASRAHTDPWSHALLLCMGLLDEIVSGIPTVALPLLRDRLGLSYIQIGLLFTVSTLSGMVFEPLINLFSDRSSKKPWILSALLILTVAFIVIGTTTSYALLIIAFVVYYPAVGASIELAQAVVIDSAPDEGVRTMTRWTLLSSIGDFLSPLLVAAFGVLHLGWTALCWLASALWLLATALLAPLRFPARHAEISQDEATNVWANLRDALRDPILLRWAALALIPNMLDEVFLGFVALYLHDVWHLNEALIALILTLQMLAALLGLFILERVLLRRGLSPVLLLTWLSLATLAGVLGLLFAHALWLVVISLLVIALSCAGWYPLAQGEAYARRPGNSGLVRTVIGLGAPFDMALPGAIGLIAASFGVLTGLGVLGLAPVLMLLLLPTRRLR